MSTDNPLVDLVIPIHDASRPLQRAINSVLDSGLELSSQLRITVVCHNVDPADVESTLSPVARESVRFFELQDDRSSPAGPFNFGLENATGRYVSIMGSDDYLEPGALRAWARRAEDYSLSALIAPERHAQGGRVRTPPVRPGRTVNLDPIRDRLAYRTAPLGLIRLDAIERLGLRFPPNLQNGSDQIFGLKLWYSGEPIGYAKGSPSYVVGADARSRVTFTSRSLEEELRATAEIFFDDWFASQAGRARAAIVTKAVRVHVFSAASVRSAQASWTQMDREYVARFLAQCDEVAPTFRRPLSWADRALLDALMWPDVTEARLKQLVNARRRFGSPATLLTRNFRGQFAIDGPLRFMLAAALL